MVRRYYTEVKAVEANSSIVIYLLESRFHTRFFGAYGITQRNRRI
jgi:hypothetical protein